MDRKVLEKMNYGVFVVGTTWQGKRVGCVVNSFAQVTSNLPQKFTITLNRDNETCKALLETGTFAVTLAGKDCPKELVNLFGYKSSRVTDKFAAYETFIDSQGNPFVKEGMVARVTCKVVDTIKDVADELVMYDKCGVIVNRVREEQIPFIKIESAEVLAYIPEDRTHAENDIMGVSVFDLPEDSPVMAGTREALRKMQLI